MQIVKGIHQIPIPIPDNPLGKINSYAVQGKAGWLIIDTGWSTQASFTALEAGLSSLGLKFNDISTVLVTHGHPDHVGLVGKIRHSYPQTKILMHRLESAFIQELFLNFDSVREKTSRLFRQHGTPSEELSLMRAIPVPSFDYAREAMPDQDLYGGEIISTGDFNLEVIWTPGHSTGHLCLYEPVNQLLFSGDHILPGITPNIGYTFHSGDNPLGDYLCSLHKLTRLPVRQILPAHEDVFDHLNRRIAEIVNHHHEREAEVNRIIGPNSSDAYTVASQLSWNIPGNSWAKFPPFQKRFAVMETIAHLEHMRWEGQLERVIGEDRVTYHLRND